MNSLIVALCIILVAVTVGVAVNSARSHAGQHCVKRERHTTLIGKTPTVTSRCVRWEADER